MFYRLYISLIFLFLYYASLISQDLAYKNAQLSIEERVKSLISQMTLQEKLNQTFCFHLYDDMIDKEGNLVFTDEINAALPNGVGQLGKPSWAFDKNARERRNRESNSGESN